MCHAELASQPPANHLNNNSFKFENIKETTDENTTAHCSVPMLKYPGDEAGPISLMVAVPLLANIASIPPDSGRLRACTGSCFNLNWRRCDRRSVHKPKSGLQSMRRSAACYYTTTNPSHAYSMSEPCTQHVRATHAACPSHMIPNCIDLSIHSLDPIPHLCCN